MKLLLDNTRVKPYDHQIVGVEKIVSNPFFFLMDEMGAGKSKQTIDAACVLYSMGLIDRVLVICPASVRSVWYNEEFGELKKHLWNNIPASVTEFHRKMRFWRSGPKDQSARFRWVITNYDFIRKGFQGKGKKKKPVGKLAEIMSYCTPKTLLVLDESSAVAHHTSQQTKACYAIRQRCGRVLLLNGTPLGQSPADLYSQGNIMNFGILACKSFIHFRSRYAEMGGWENKQIVGWIDGAIEDMQNRFAPYAIRRLKKDCIDLPEKLTPVITTVPLDKHTWDLYKQMRDDLVAWLTDDKVATASIALIKALRLSQITSGFIGGVEDAIEGENSVEAPPEWLPYERQGQYVEENNVKEFLVGPGVSQISTEKLDHYIEWLGDRFNEKPVFKSICWCRFLPEVFQTVEAIKKHYPDVIVAPLTGQSKRQERDYVLRLLNPETSPRSPIVVVGTLGTGAMGLNFTAADTSWYRSLHRSRRIIEQSKDRTHRPGQRNPTSYFYQVATGPNGQQTIDHLIVKSLQGLTDLVDMTCAAWVAALTKE